MIYLDKIYVFSEKIKDFIDESNLLRKNLTFFSTNWKMSYKICTFTEQN